MSFKSEIKIDSHSKSTEYSLTDEQHEQYVKLMRYIHSIMNEQFFGKLEISFQNGKLSSIKKTETLKI